MSVKQPTDIAFAFGSFEADLQTQELRRQGIRLRLPGQSFQILAMLLQRPGQLISREELQQTLWPGNSLVDSEKGLNAAINRLREALGDSAENPRYVETLPRRGYRFIALVTDVSPAKALIVADSASAPAPAGIANAPSMQPSGTFFSRYWLSAALVSLIVLIVLAWAARRRALESIQTVERKLTTNSSENSVKSAAVSPDGKYLAYTDNAGMYLKIISTGEIHPVPLPPDFFAHVDDWFPDGSHLLVTRQEQPGELLPGKLSLWTISVFGGTPRKLADDGRAGAVSPDGTHVAFQRLDYGREEWVMRADGTEQMKVAAADQSSWVGQPTWSPDGNKVAYIRSTESYNSRESSVEVNDWRTASAKIFFADHRLGPSVYWLPNGFLVYCLGDSENQQGASLWMISPPQGGKATSASKRLTPREIGWISQFTASDDGRVLSFLRENASSSIFVARLAADGNRLLESRKLTFDENQNFASAWTPDSKTILFHSDRNGTSEIFKQAIDKTLAETLISSDTEQFLQPRVTPDGSEVLFISAPRTADLSSHSSVLALPIAGGPPRPIVQDIGIWTAQCARLPSTLCMYSITKGDATETYRFDIRTGKTSDPPQVDPLCNWSLSPDGSRRAIIAAGLKGRIRFRSTVSGETSELLVTGWEDMDSIDWSADGKSLFVGWHHEFESALLRVSLNGTVSVLFRSNSPQVIGAIQSPDGRSLAFAGLSTTRNVWKIENF